jgi:hypothetical protein
MRIRIQLFSTVGIRIQGDKPMRIPADPDPGQTLPHKKLNFYMEKIHYVGNTLNVIKHTYVC